MDREFLSKALIKACGDPELRESILFLASVSSLAQLAADLASIISPASWAQAKRLRESGKAGELAVEAICRALASLERGGEG